MSNFGAGTLGCKMVGGLLALLHVRPRPAHDVASHRTNNAEAVLHAEILSCTLMRILDVKSNAYATKGIVHGDNDTVSSSAPSCHGSSGNAPPISLDDVHRNENEKGERLARQR